MSIEPRAWPRARHRSARASTRLAELHDHFAGDIRRAGRAGPIGDRTRGSDRSASDHVATIGRLRHQRADAAFDRRRREVVEHLAPRASRLTAAAIAANQRDGGENRDPQSRVRSTTESRHWIILLETFTMAETLFEKVWHAHTVRTLPTGQTQLFVGLHLIHEVTTPQAFDMLRQHRLARRVSRAHVRHGRSHRADAGAAAAVSRRDGRGDDRGARAQLPRVRHPAVDAGQRQPGHRPRHRSRARAHAAGHDDRVRRQPHVDARRARRDRVRHRHLAGARRARVAVPGARPAEGAAHRRQRPPGARRLREGRDPRRSSAGSACTAASASPTSTAAHASTRCRSTSA